MMVTAGEGKLYAIELQNTCSGIRSADRSLAHTDDSKNGVSSGSHLMDGKGSLILYARDLREGFTARVTLNQPEEITVLLLNSNGTLIAKRQLPAYSTVIETDFILPVSGVYLVKVITGSGKAYNARIVIP
jgi:hypothetical protein